MKPASIRAFRKILREFERLSTIQDTSCCEGVTLPQCHVVLEVEELSQTSIGELAQKLGLDKSTLSRTVDTLVKRGDMKRREDPEDRRYAMIGLTSKGQGICEGINTENDRFYQQVFDRLPEGEGEQFLSLFQKFVSAMKKNSQLDGNSDCCAE
jgi:DNA-binding MarR family transcriptional regulator